MPKPLQPISIAALALLALAPVALAQAIGEKTPPELAGVGVVEHLGAQLDLNLQFTAEDGYQHPLREYFASGRPVILNLLYYNCPMLCNLVLNGQVAALRKIDWTPGKEYEIVTISIDPTENYALAKSKKAGYLASYERPAPGWHFLTDYNGSVARLASQIGFGYKRDEATGQYAHAAVIYVITPEGKVSRYLYGINFKPFDIRLSLVEAAREKFGLSAEKFLLYCFHYDPVAKSYTLFARNVMRIGGALSLLVLGLALFFLWRRERLPSTYPMVNAK
jgi:protein SCO1/2